MKERLLSRFLRIVLPALLAAAIVHSCYAAETPPDWFAPLVPRIDATIRKDQAERHWPGLSVAVVAGGRLVWSAACGEADVARHVPVGPETRFGLGSVSKLFTALAVMRLRDQGKIVLDAPLRQYLPWFRLAGDAAPDITVREVLTQVAGLPREPPGGSWQDRTMPDRDALMRDLAEMPAALKPETQWKYSNLGYALLGEAVSAASGMSFSAYVAEEVLKPLGMTETTLGPHVEPRALGYDAAAPDRSRAARADFDLGAAAPAGGFFSTARDLAKLLVWMTDETAPGPVGPHTKREMLRAHTVYPDWSGAEGLGFEIRRKEGRIHIGHAGLAAGYAARVEIDPATRSGVALLINADDGAPTKLVEAIEAIVEPAVPPPVMPPADPRWSEYVGRYRSRTGESGIAVAGGRLAWIDPARPEASRITLTPAGRDRFTFDSGSLIGEIVSFERDAAGRVVRMRAAGATDERVDELSPAAPAPARDPRSAPTP